MNMYFERKMRRRNLAPTPGIKPVFYLFSNQTVVPILQTGNCKLIACQCSLRLRSYFSTCVAMLSLCL